MYIYVHLQSSWCRNMEIWGPEDLPWVQASWVCTILGAVRRNLWVSIPTHHCFIGTSSSCILSSSLSQWPCEKLAVKVTLYPQYRNIGGVPPLLLTTFTFCSSEESLVPALSWVNGKRIPDAICFESGIISPSHTLYSLRHDISFLSSDSLIFADDLAALSPTAVHLVDHNIPDESQSELEGKIRGVVDHHNQDFFPEDSK